MTSRMARSLAPARVWVSGADSSARVKASRERSTLFGLVLDAPEGLRIDELSGDHLWRWVAEGGQVFIFLDSPQSVLDVVLRGRMAVSATGTTPLAAITCPDADKPSARVRVRYRHEGAAAKIEPAASATAHVHFEQPIQAVTPGQAAVFYAADDSDVVLGGGWIAGAS